MKYSVRVCLTNAKSKRRKLLIISQYLEMLVSKNSKTTADAEKCTKIFMQMGQIVSSQQLKTNKNTVRQN